VGSSFVHAGIAILSLCLLVYVSGSVFARRVYRGCGQLACEVQGVCLYRNRRSLYTLRQSVVAREWIWMNHFKWEDREFLLMSGRK
jgi:hypothetical protein